MQILNDQIILSHPNSNINISSLPPAAIPSVYISPLAPDTTHDVSIAPVQPLTPSTYTFLAGTLFMFITRTNRGN